MAATSEVTKTNPKQAKPPVAPPEVWALWNTETGNWVPALDSEGDPYLWFESREDAGSGAATHRADYDVQCIPVNVLALARG